MGAAWTRGPSLAAPGREGEERSLERAPREVMGWRLSAVSDEAEVNATVISRRGQEGSGRSERKLTEQHRHVKQKVKEK